MPRITTSAIQISRKEANQFRGRQKAAAKKSESGPRRSKTANWQIVDTDTQ